MLRDADRPADGCLNHTDFFDYGGVLVPAEDWLASQTENGVLREPSQEPSENGSSRRKWVRPTEFHVYHHRDDHMEPVETQIEDPKALLAWSETRQDEYKKRLTTALLQGQDIWKACAELGISKYTLAFWKDNDERIGALFASWESARVLQFEERFDDVFFHPERYREALGKPAWFTFAISRLKAMSSRYKDNTQINVDARSISVGTADGSALVGKARDDATIIEGVKKQLLQRNKRPGKAL